MEKTPRLTYAKLGDNPAPIVSVTRMCKRCGWRPVKGGKKSQYCKPCSNQAVAEATKGRNMRPKTVDRCACGKPVESAGSKFCPSCNALRNADMLRHNNPMKRPEVVEARKGVALHHIPRDPFTPRERPKIISDAEQRAIDYAARNSTMSTRAEEDPRIMARLLRGAVVPTLPVGYAEAGKITPIEDIPETPRAGQVALNW